MTNRVEKLQGPEVPTTEKLSEAAELCHWSDQHGCNIAMSACWERITPEYARYVWNNLNKANRSLRSRSARTVQTAVDSGNFIPTGQTIIFDVSGDLQDGQHRIYAVANSNKPIDALVVRGAPPSNFTKIDIGRSRNTADTLQARGIANPVMVAAIVRNVRQFEDTGTVSRRGSPLSNDEALKFVGERPNIQLSANYVTQLVGRKHDLVGLTPSQLGFVHYMTSRYHKVAADEFVRLLVCPATDLVGYGEQKEVVKHLRDRLSHLVSKRNNARVSTSLSEAQVVGMTLAAWNVFARIGRRLIKKLQAPKMVDTGKLDANGQPIMRWGMPAKILMPSPGAVASILQEQSKKLHVQQLLAQTYGAGNQQSLAPVQSDQGGYLNDGLDYQDDELEILD